MSKAGYEQVPNLSNEPIRNALPPKVWAQSEKIGLGLLALACVVAVATFAVLLMAIFVPALIFGATVTLFKAAAWIFTLATVGYLISVEAPSFIEYFQNNQDTQASAPDFSGDGLAPTPAPAASLQFNKPAPTPKINTEPVVSEAIRDNHSDTSSFSYTGK